MTNIVRGEDLHKPTRDFPILRNAHRNNKTVWMLPTRGSLPIEVHVSLRNMFVPMNTPRICLERKGAEVGVAYDDMVQIALDAPETKDFPFFWTYEEDNIQPGDVLLKLYDAIWTCIDCGEPMPMDPKTKAPAEPWECPNGHKGLDGVGALYFTKSEPRAPMAYGDPTSPEIEMRPRDVTQAMKDGAVIEVNGLAMGSTLWRRSLFERIPQPWFKTLNGDEEMGGRFTQDLYFCRKAKEEVNARFAVHCGVKVGHLDVSTGVVY